MEEPLLIRLSVLKNQTSTFSPDPSVSSLAVIRKFDYVFAENGTVQYKDGKLLSKYVSEQSVPCFILSHSTSQEDMIV